VSDNARKSKSADESVTPFGTGGLVGEQYSLVEPGLYELAFVEHRTLLLFGRQPKLRLDFRIVSLGKGNGATVCRWYNIKSFKGKKGRNGDFQCAPRSDFYKEYCRLFNSLLRRDRIPMTPFGKDIIIGEVGTVKRDHQQESHPEATQYSVIKKLIRRKER